MDYYLQSGQKVKYKLKKKQQNKIKSSILSPTCKNNDWFWPKSNSDGKTHTPWHLNFSANENPHLNYIAFQSSSLLNNSVSQKYTAVEVETWATNKWNNCQGHKIKSNKFQNRTFDLKSSFMFRSLDASPAL